MKVIRYVHKYKSKNDKDVPFDMQKKIKSPSIQQEIIN